MGKFKNFILKKLGILSLTKKVESLETMDKKLEQKNEADVARLTERDRDNQRRLAELERRCTQLEKQIITYRNTLLYLENRINQSDKRFGAQISNLETYIFSQNRGLCQKERKPRIIVSMTSYPGRISVVSAVLERMLVQTLRPDKIILWLSKNQFPGQEADLPEDLLAMREYGVEIGWCEGDIKAYKKVLPALKKYPEDLIVIVDDDLVYRVDLVEKLYLAHLAHPEAIVASRAHRIVNDEDGKIISYEQWLKECDEDAYEIKEDWFFTGGAGTLFPPGVYGEEVFNTDLIQKICPYADDIWLNIHAAIKAIPIVNTAINNHLTYIEGTQGEGLYNINKEQNDVQLNKVVNHYKDLLQDSIYKNL